MIGKILDLRDFDCLGVVSCKGKFCYDYSDCRPIIIDTEISVVGAFGRVDNFYLIEEYDGSKFVTTAIYGDDVRDYYSLCNLGRYLENQYSEDWLFQDSEREDCETVEAIVLPLVKHGVAVSSKVLAFMEKPLTLELLRETFPNKDFPWNKTESENS